MKESPLEGCELYAVCSEVQDEADKAAVEWNLQQFAAVIGDNDNVLVRHVQERYLPDLYITDCTHKQNEHGFNAKDYPCGAVQPALLMFVGEKVALTWACSPSVANLQGSLSRPEPVQVWKVLQDCVEGVQQGRPVVCRQGDDLTKTSRFHDLLTHYGRCDIL